MSVRRREWQRQGVMNLEQAHFLSLSAAQGQEKGEKNKDEVEPRKKGEVG